MAELFNIMIMCFIGLVSSVENNRVMVQQGTLEKAMEMMEENDDWMNTLKFMMNNSTRGFKVESRRVVEYSQPDSSPDSKESQTKRTGTATMAIHEDIMPPGMSQNNHFRRNIISASDFPVFINRPRRIGGTKTVVGDVGVCKTQFKVELLHTAKLMRKPNAPAYPLAHSVPAAVGRCRQSFPAIATGSSNGKCVLAAQAHIAWLVVPEMEAKEFETCVDIPGITALKKCADWIVFGGRCVYDMNM